MCSPQPCSSWIGSAHAALRYQFTFGLEHLVVRPSSVCRSLAAALPRQNEAVL